jgi:Raf kinase inhibitor-like YbhB/YbcL family protein
MAFTLTSNSFKDGDYLPNDFIFGRFRFWLRRRQQVAAPQMVGRTGGHKELCGHLLRSDAPTCSGFWHWLVVNIPTNVGELTEGAGSTGGNLPAGALQTRTDFGAPGYGGPCPPQGDQPADVRFNRTWCSTIVMSALCHFRTNCIAAKIEHYSITSSAVASSADGIDKPSVFAVLRLITRLVEISSAARLADRRVWLP